MINKPIILKDFRLNSYKGTLSLNSLYRAEIVPLTGHRYNEIDLSKLSLSDFRMITEKDKQTEVAVSAFR